MQAIPSATRWKLPIPENDTLTYSLGRDGCFLVRHRHVNGQLKTKSTLDKETDDTYEVIVSVHDGKNAAGATDATVDDTIDVTITVTDANDPPSVSGRPLSIMPRTTPVR